VEVWGARLCVSLNYNCTHTSAGRYGIHEIQIQTLWDARRSLLIHFIKGVEKVAGQTNGWYMVYLDGSGLGGWYQNIPKAVGVDRRDVPLSWVLHSGLLKTFKNFRPSYP